MSATRAFAAALALGACVTAAVPMGPAREPVGHRAKTPQGVDLVFDPVLQLYAVPSSPGAYWQDGRFFRRTGSGVDCAAQLDGPWAACPAGELPERLR